MHLTPSVLITEEPLDSSRVNSFLMSAAGPIRVSHGLSVVKMTLGRASVTGGLGIHVGTGVNRLP